MLLLCFYMGTFDFIGLQKYGAYSVRIAAESQFGAGPYSVAIEFRTLEDCKCFDTFVYLHCTLFQWFHSQILKHQGISR